MAKTKSFRTQNNLAQNVREKAIALLNQQLADTLDLFSQIKQAHWNVKGMQFHQLHVLFDSLAEDVNTNSSAGTPIRSATDPRARSTASRAARPRACRLDAFPKRAPR